MAEVNLPSNSDRSREINNSIPAQVKPKCISKNGVVAQKHKKSFGEKLVDSFVRTDLDSMEEELIDHRLIPFIHDSIIDAIFNAVSLLLTGEVCDKRLSGTRNGPRGSSGYDGYYKGSDSGKNYRSTYNSNVHHWSDYKRIRIPDYQFSELMKELEYVARTRENHTVTVGDLFITVGWSSDAISEDYGWFIDDLQDFGSEPSGRGEVIIRMPRARFLK